MKYMSKLKDSYIDEEPEGYNNLVFTKVEESKLQEYLDEIEAIKTRYNNRVCKECGIRLDSFDSIPEKKCATCRGKFNYKKKGGYVNYPSVSINEMNDYLGL